MQTHDFTIKEMIFLIKTLLKDAPLVFQEPDMTVTYSLLPENQVRQVMEGKYFRGMSVYEGIRELIILIPNVEYDALISAVTAKVEEKYGVKIEEFLKRM